MNFLSYLEKYTSCRNTERASSEDSEKLEVDLSLHTVTRKLMERKLPVLNAKSLDISRMIVQS